MCAALATGYHGRAWQQGLSPISQLQRTGYNDSNLQYTGYNDRQGGFLDRNALQETICGFFVGAECL